VVHPAPAPTRRRDRSGPPGRRVGGVGGGRRGVEQPRRGGPTRGGRRHRRAGRRAVRGAALPGAQGPPRPRDRAPRARARPAARGHRRARLRRHDHRGGGVAALRDAPRGRARRDPARGPRADDERVDARGGGDPRHEPRAPAPRDPRERPVPHAAAGGARPPLRDGTRDLAHAYEPDLGEPHRGAQVRGEREREGALGVHSGEERTM
ncbi:MAG: protein of unknown function DUF218, partial [uncultured Gemmatimonadaceae bacterium]